MTNNFLPFLKNLLLWKLHSTYPEHLFWKFHNWCSQNGQITEEKSQQTENFRFVIYITTENNEQKLSAHSVNDTSVCKEKKTGAKGYTRRIWLRKILNFSHLRALTATMMLRVVPPVLACSFPAFQKNFKCRTKFLISD